MPLGPRALEPFHAPLERVKLGAYHDHLPQELHHLVKPDDHEVKARVGALKARLDGRHAPLDRDQAVESFARHAL